MERQSNIADHRNIANLWQTGRLTHQLGIDGERLPTNGPTDQSTKNWWREASDGRTDQQIDRPTDHVRKEERGTGDKRNENFNERIMKVWKKGEKNEWKGHISPPNFFTVGKELQLKIFSRARFNIPSHFVFLSFIAILTSLVIKKRL